MKKLSVCLIVSACICSGCTLDDVVSHGKTKCEAAYIQTSVGKCQVSGNNGSLDCDAHISAVKTGYCPVDYDACSADQSGVMFCHTVCGESQVYCGEQCIDPKSSMTHCGAKGACNNSESASDDYRGAECTDGLTCKSGVCSSDNNCFDGQHKKPGGGCEDDSFEHCGSDANNCSDHNMKTGDCINGACQATECKKGYHLNDSGCELETDSCCGAECVDCGVDSCLNGACKITEACGDNQHNDADGQCVDNTVEACGNLDCREMTGWQDGDCIDGKCVLKSCIEGYTYENGSCAVSKPVQECTPGWSKCTLNGETVCIDTNNSVDNCGKCGFECPSIHSAGVSCVEGNCKYSCNGGLTSCGSETDCRNLQEDNNNCGECGKSCGEHSYCKDGTCKKTECPATEHLNKSGNCEPDSESACGPASVNCLGENVESAECISASCLIKSCKSGYHPNANSSACDQDSKTACGSEKVDCTAIEGVDSSSVACTDGKCVVNGCIEGRHYDRDKTECVVDTIKACGHWNYSCVALEGVDSGRVSCLGGKCVVSGCLSGYHVASDKTKCDVDTAKACGSTAQDCTKTDGWKHGGCYKGSCVVTECTDPYAYRLVNNSKGVPGCSKNTFSNAWDCGYYDCVDMMAGCECVSTKNSNGMPYCSLPTDEYSGTNYDPMNLTYCGGTYDGTAWKWTCKSIAYYEVMSSCDVMTEHAYSNGLCEANDVENCGATNFNCATNVLGWKKGECVGYSSEAFCSATECQDGYKRVKVKDIDNGTVYLCEPTFKVE